MSWRGLTWPLVIVLTVFLARRYLDVVEVRGRSMAPTLHAGDRLLAVRLRARAGDVVLATDPRDPRRELIKRATSVDRHRVRLRGDNAAASTDARTFGAVPADAVSWRVILRYWPLDRVGRVPPARVKEGGERPAPFPM